MLFLALFLHIVTSVTALPYFSGCTVKEQQTIPWPWLEGEIGLWVDGNLTEPIFKIHLTAADDSTTQVLTISRTSARWSLDQKEEYVDFPYALEEGWGKFSLKVAEGDFTLSRRTWSTSELLFDLAQAKSIENITVTGSNVTLNCINDEYSWLVPDEGPVVVPLGPEGRSHSFYFFSQSSMKPLLMFSSEKIQLGWNGEMMTTDESAMGLPAEVYHEVVLQCSGESPHVSCSLKTGTNESEKVIHRFDLDAWPRSFSLQSVDKTRFLFTLSSWQEFDHRASRIGTRIRIYVPTGGAGHGPPTVGTIVVLTISIALLVLMIGLRLRTEWKKRKPLKAKANIEEGITLMDAPPPSQSYAQFQAAVAANQQNACMVAGYEQAEPRRLSFKSSFNRNSKRLKDISMEVHKRGDKSCLVVINNHFDQDNVTFSNVMILKILKYYEEVTGDIFKAALSGQYEGVGGVKGLLVNNSLPGTIQDQHGRSLLHYAAFAKGPSRDPLWIPDHVKDLVKQHNCYTGAVDFAGQNPLHTLARSCGNSKAWLKMAEVLIELGCDTQQKDYQGHTPADRITDFPELCVLFSKEREHPSGEGPRKDLGSACDDGDSNTVAEHLQRLPPLRLSLHHPEDLIARAIRGGHRDLMLLLLSAGESVLGGCLGPATPLEISHTTEDTPAIFPAVLRKVFCDTLTGEITKITETDSASTTLRTSLKDIKKSVYRQGFDTMFLHKLPKDRALLCKAAELGLSVTCQLLSMGGTRRVALCFEDQLFQCAVRASGGLREDLLYTLVRDLKTCPYSITEIDHEIPIDFHKNLWERDFNLLRNEDKNSLHNLSEEVDKLIKSTDAEHPVLSDKLKDSVVQLNLFAVLERVRKDTNTDFSHTRNQELGNTLLAICIQHDNLSMAEYLLCQGVESTDINSYTDKPEGDVEKESNSCLKYILKYSRERRETDNE